MNIKPINPPLSDYKEYLNALLENFYEAIVEKEPTMGMCNADFDLGEPISV